MATHFGVCSALPSCSHRLNYMPYHSPVLLERSIELLEISPNGHYADLTFGGGGHSRAILAELNSEGHLYCFDRDAEAFTNLPDDPRLTPVHANYAHLARWLCYLNAPLLDGVIVDLGVSSHHLDDEARGFSYRFDAPLDMRMNQQGATTAAQLLASYDEKALVEIFVRYGELRTANKLAQAIVTTRSATPLATTGQLAELVERVYGRGAHLPKILACVFQALRIEVNAELQSLERLLEQLPELIKTGGRVVVLSYHSLEDKLVKNFFRTGRCDGILERDLFGNTAAPFSLLSKGAERALAEEQNENTRSRSARLRVGERIANER